MKYQLLAIVLSDSTKHGKVSLDIRNQDYQDGLTRYVSAVLISLEMGDGYYPGPRYRYPFHLRNSNFLAVRLDICMPCSILKYHIQRILSMVIFGQLIFFNFKLWIDSVFFFFFERQYINCSRRKGLDVYVPDDRARNSKRANRAQDHPSCDKLRFPVYFHIVSFRFVFFDFVL